MRVQCIRPIDWRSRQISFYHELTFTSIEIRSNRISAHASISPIKNNWPTSEQQVPNRNTKCLLQSTTYFDNNKTNIHSVPWRKDQRFPRFSDSLLTTTPTLNICDCVQFQCRSKDSCWLKSSKVQWTTCTCRRFFVRAASTYKYAHEMWYSSQRWASMYFAPCSTVVPQVQLINICSTSKISMAIIHIWYTCMR